MVLGARYIVPCKKRFSLGFASPAHDFTESKACLKQSKVCSTFQNIPQNRFKPQFIRRNSDWHWWKRKRSWHILLIRDSV